MNFHRVDSFRSEGKTGAERIHAMRLRRFVGREIVAWDGEGVTDPDTNFHRYVLLAYTTSSGNRGHVTAGPGKTLTLERCAETMLRVAAAHPDALHIMFAGDYDLMMMLRGYSAPSYKAFKNSLIRLRREKGYSRFNGYLINWTPHKGFSLVKTATKERIRIWDVFTYFQCSFIKAAEDYLGKDYGEDIAERICEGKSRRSQFTEAELPQVTEYCYAELKILVDLFSSLRDSLAKADLLVSAFDGPGAIAATLMGKHNIKRSMQQPPPEVREAAQYAYAGGRFETFKFGHVETPVHEYDINSAYPEAISQLPNLAGGTWIHSSVDTGEPFTLFRVKFRETSPKTRRPLPLALRDKLGNIIFSNNVHTWCWRPEYDLARYYCERYQSARLELIESWAFVPRDSSKPFAFVPAVYTQRQEYKRDGNEAQRALKLALNSLYGKMAQRVGYNADEKPPPYHQLEWAGWVTSYTRAKLARMVYDQPTEPEDNLIAFATDAAFLRFESPTVILGGNLGEWEQICFRDFSWLTSGIYAGTLDDGTTYVNRSRGIPVGELTRDRIIDCIATGNPIKITRSQFHGIGACLQLGNFQTFAKWIPTTKEYMYPYRASKRVHLFHESCGHTCEPRDGRALTLGEWHNTFVDPIAFITPPQSNPHDLPWIREKEEEERLWVIPDAE